MYATKCCFSHTHVYNERENAEDVGILIRS